MGSNGPPITPSLRRVTDRQRTGAIGADVDCGNYAKPNLATLRSSGAPRDSVKAHAASDGQQLVDHSGELLGRPALVHGDDAFVAGHRRVATAPQMLGLGVEPVC